MIKILHTKKQNLLTPSVCAHKWFARMHRHTFYSNYNCPVCSISKERIIYEINPKFTSSIANYFEVARRVGDMGASESFFFSPQLILLRGSIA